MTAIEKEEKAMRGLNWKEIELWSENKKGDRWKESIYVSFVRAPKWWRNKYYQYM